MSVGNAQVEPLNGTDIDLWGSWIQAALLRLSWVWSESFKQRQMDWSFYNSSNPPLRGIKLQVPEGVRKAHRSIHISCCSTAGHGLADIMEPRGVQSGPACACVSMNLFIWWWVKYALPLSKIMLIQVLWGTEAELIFKHEWFPFSYIWSTLHKSYMWIYHIKCCSFKTLFPELQLCVATRLKDWKWELHNICSVQAETVIWKQQRSP